jgi:predicted peptidase
MKSIWILLAMAALVPLPASVAADELYQPKVYTKAEGQELKYRLMIPKDYSATGEQKYPVVLFLHGAGERGDDNARQLAHGTKEFATDANRDKYACFVIAPQCPSGQWWGDSLPLIVDLLADMQKEYRIDANRLYVTGLSMGGFGTWDLLGRHPQMFAAAAPICGGGDPETCSKFSKVPIWVFHGDADKVVRPEQSRRMVDGLKKAGGMPKYTEYPGVGHDSWSQTYADTAFIEWLFNQKRTP